MPETRPTPLIAGVDEAGRGPLAGPVVCAAVVLPMLEAMAASEVVKSMDLGPDSKPKKAKRSRKS